MLPITVRPVNWLGAGTAAFCLAALVPSKRWTAPLLLVAGLLCVTFPLASQRFLYPYFSGCPQPDWRPLAGAADVPADAPGPPPRMWAQAAMARLSGLMAGRGRKPRRS